MTQMQFAIILALMLLPLTGAAFCCLAMLERIEKHLRAEHVSALGPMREATPEDMKIRRQDLGLDDGYPYKQQKEILFAMAGTLLVIYLGSTFWPW